MAQIKTIDGEVHQVEEHINEIEFLLRRQSKGYISLNIHCSISGYEGGIETTRYEYQRAVFMTHSIIMYY